ncbi:unnamed protein product [Musa acuminata subsp. malaccensis]|uniref:(wild Malaysian banana) hypothetical protein n=1 Tax=Musa acuminata subsp. malaccensis TaxID=214687 RepID=A0A804ICH4_MUSAM|nr:unnamed protein product [Musa acuminata subsp. malaccensis]
MPPQYGAPDKDTNLGSMQNMATVAITTAAVAIAMAAVAAATAAVAAATATVVAAMATKAAVEEEAIAKEVGDSYSEEERWGNVGEHNTRDAADEGNRRWRRVAVEKTIAVRRRGKICRTDGLTMKKQW